jgi:hypothetical protein
MSDADVAAKPMDSAPQEQLSGGYQVRRRALRVAAVLAAAIVVAAGSEIGWWFLPFAVGLIFGAVTRGRRRRARGAALGTGAAVLAGWAIPFGWRMADGEPVGATASAIASLAGLPASATLMIAVTLMLALLQGLCGTWLARAVLSLRRTTR